MKDSTNLALASDARIVWVVLNPFVMARLTRVRCITERTQVEIVAVRAAVRLALDRIGTRQRWTLHVPTIDLAYKFVSYYDISSVKWKNHFIFNMFSIENSKEIHFACKTVVYTVIISVKAYISKFIIQQENYNPYAADLLILLFLVVSRYRIPI